MAQFYCLILLPEGEQQPVTPEHPDSGQWQEHAKLASRYLKLRARRSEISNGHLFSDPAWDILLDLFVGRVNGRDVTVTSACIASGRPSTTSLRYIDRMSQNGLLYRQKDTHDHRKVYLRITDSAFHTVADWIGSLREQTIGI